MQAAHQYWQADGRLLPQAIAERWSVSRVAVGRWLGPARELGYVDPDQER